jgi:hypothetical protein
VVLTAYIRVFGGAREFAQDFAAGWLSSTVWRSQQLVVCSRSSNILEWREKKWERCQEIEQQRHICPDVREWREAYWSAECPAIEAISVCPGLESCSASQPGGKGRNRCVSDENEEAIRDNRRR